MSNQVANVAIIGLGRVGGRFLAELARLEARGVHVSCVAEQADTPAKHDAQKHGIAIKTLDEIVALGDQIDVIFDLTGSDAVRSELRAKLSESGNRHTVLAPEVVARMLWAALSDKQFSDAHARSGY